MVHRRPRRLRVPSWRLVYLHDTSGAAIEGAKSALFDAIRRGYPIRFAWGAAVGTPEKPASVEHAAEPVFLTIMGESELFVQLPEHIAQASYHEPSRAAFGKPAVMWRGMMGTDGSFDAVMVDRASGKEVRRMPQRARIAWFAYAPEPLCAGKPVKLAERNGVVRETQARGRDVGVLNDTRQFRRIVRLGQRGDCNIGVIACRFHLPRRENDGRSVVRSQLMRYADPRTGDLEVDVYESDVGRAWCAQAPVLRWTYVRVRARRGLRPRASQRSSRQ